jgi:hypothetical protein
MLGSKESDATPTSSCSDIGLGDPTLVPLVLGLLDLPGEPTREPFRARVDRRRPFWGLPDLLGRPFSIGEEARDEDGDPPELSLFAGEPNLLLVPLLDLLGVVDRLLILSPVIIARPSLKASSPVTVSPLSIAFFNFPVATLSFFSFVESL